MNETTYEETADTAENKDGKILMRDDSIRQAQEKTKEEPDGPPRPGRQLHAADDQADCETAGESTQQSSRLVR